MIWSFLFLRRLLQAIQLPLNICYSYSRLGRLFPAQLLVNLQSNHVKFPSLLQAKKPTIIDGRQRMRRDRNTRMVPSKDLLPPRKDSEVVLGRDDPFLSIEPHSSNIVERVNRVDMRWPQNLATNLQRPF